MPDLLMRGRKYHGPERRAVVAMAFELFDA